MRLAAAATLIAATWAVPVTAWASLAETAPTDPGTTDLPVASTPDTAGVSSPTGEEISAADDNSAVSIWWWIGGAAVAAAAVYGVAFSIRRRNDTETWARGASTACDIGRAMSLTLTTLLAEETVWSASGQYTDQQQRFRQHLHDLALSVPDADLPELLAGVTAADERLRSVVAQLADGTPIPAAREALQPAIDDLATALSSLEAEASTIVFGASLPSSRPTG